jgi:hypothetical protein
LEVIGMGKEFLRLSHNFALVHEFSTVHYSNRPCCLKIAGRLEMDEHML